MLGAWSWWKWQWSETACLGAEVPRPGLPELLPSEAGPISWASCACYSLWPVTLHWTVTLSSASLFSQGPISHIVDFVERIIMFTQLCICRRLRTLFRFEHGPSLMRSAFQHTPYFLLPFLSQFDFLLPSSFCRVPLAECNRCSIILRMVQLMYFNQVSAV